MPDPGKLCSDLGKILKALRLHLSQGQAVAFRRDTAVNGAAGPTTYPVLDLYPNSARSHRPPEQLISPSMASEDVEPSPPPEPARRISFVSLGCPKALVDSERIITRLRAEGYELARRHDGADLVIVNTCGFLDSAQAESLDAIGAALKENGKVIVTGCMGAEPEKISERFPNVLAITGPQQYESVVDAVHRAAPPPRKRPWSASGAGARSAPTSPCVRPSSSAFPARPRRNSPSCSTGSTKPRSTGSAASATSRSRAPPPMSPGPPFPMRSRRNAGTAS